MSTPNKLDLILTKTSSELNANINEVLKCKEIPDVMRNYYSTINEPFLSKFGVSIKGNSAKEIVRGALFYYSEAMPFFSYFGIECENPSLSKPVNFQGVIDEKLLHFLFSSVKHLYIILWETFRGFFEPLENLYSVRLCESGIFPEKYQLFPYPMATDKTELDFREFFIRRGTTFYRISESLPFELRFVYKAAPYFKECFDCGKEKTQSSAAMEYIDDFIRLFFVRNSVCHLKKSVINQADAEKQQNLFHDLTTLLPKVQDSCIGIVSAFEVMAKKEVG